MRKQVALALAAFIERPQAESSRRYAVKLGASTGPVKPAYSNVARM